MYFARLPGVVRTRVGYTGGKKANPTYHSLGGHTEAVQIEFNPQQITFQQLLSKFWAQHDATRKAGTQYKSAIWYQTQEQRNVALESMKKEEAKPFYRGRSIVTDVAPLRKFFLAEDYHQKYLDRSLLAKNTLY